MWTTERRYEPAWTNFPLVISYKRKFLQGKDYLKVWDVREEEIFEKIYEDPYLAEPIRAERDLLENQFGENFIRDYIRLLITSRRNLTKSQGKSYKLQPWTTEEIWARKKFRNRAVFLHNTDASDRPGVAGVIGREGWAARIAIRYFDPVPVFKVRPGTWQYRVIYHKVPKKEDEPRRYRLEKKAKELEELKEKIRRDHRTEIHREVLEFYDKIVLWKVQRRVQKTIVKESLEKDWKAIFEKIEKAEKDAVEWHSPHVKHPKKVLNEYECYSFQATLDALYIHHDEEGVDQAGAYIVVKDEDDVIWPVGYGLAGPPSDEELREKLDKQWEAEGKPENFYHATMNALRECANIPLTNAASCSTCCPCKPCVRKLIDAGVKRIAFQMRKTTDTFRTSGPTAMMVHEGGEYDLFFYDVLVCLDKSLGKSKVLAGTWPETYFTWGEEIHWIGGEVEWEESWQDLGRKQIAREESLGFFLH